MEIKDGQAMTKLEQKNKRTDSMVKLFLFLLLIPFCASAKDLYQIHPLSEQQIQQTYIQLLHDACLCADSDWTNSSFDPKAGYWGLGFSGERDGIRPIGSMVLAYFCFIFAFINEGRRYFRVHAEMELASEIHRVLVPKIEATIGDFEFFGRSQPSGRVGGDLIDLVRSGDRWIAYIADVSGHGVAPGVLMGMVKSAARMYLSSHEDSGHFLERLNSVLQPISKPEMFVTMAFLAWDGTRLAFSTAGHPPILQYCLQNKSVNEFSCANLPVGMFSSATFAVDFVSPGKGDLFLLCTDGLLEVTDKGNAEFGIPGMKAVLSSTDHQPLNAIADKVLAATEAFGQTHDDESLLLIRYRLQS